MTQSALERERAVCMPGDRALSVSTLPRFPLATLAPPVLLVVLPLILFWPLVLGGRVLYWGTPLLQFYPWRSLAAELYKAGQLPIWNPYLGTGFPLAANLQSAVFYPINQLLFLVVPTEVGLGWSVVVHVILAGLFTYAFAGSVRLTRWASLLCAISYMFSGFFIARAEFLSMTSAAPWLPVLLLAIEAMRRGAIEPGGRKRVLGASVTLMAGSTLLLLAGHAQWAFYSFLCAVAYAGVRAVQVIVGRDTRRGEGVRKGLIFLAAVALSLVLSFCAAGIQLVPAAELTQLSVRAGGAERELALTYSLWPLQILGVLAPDVFGNPASDTYWGPGNYWEVASYIGVLPCLLALVAIWNVRRARDRALSGLFAVLAALSLLLATGKYLPIFVFAYEHVPGFGSFQGPARLLFFYTFSMAYLSGVGLDLLLSRGVERASNLGRTFVLVGVGFLVAGALGVMIAGSVLGIRITFADALLKLGLLLAISGLLLSLPSTARRLLGETGTWAKRAAACWPAALLVFVAADLFVYGAPLNPTASPQVYQTADLPMVQFLRASLGAYRLYTPESSFLATFHRFFGFKGFGPSDAGSVSASAGLLPPNVSLSARLPEAFNYDPLQLEDLHRLQQMTDESLRSSLLSVMAVRYVLTDTLPVDADLPLVSETSSPVYQNPDPLPRSFVSYVPRWASNHHDALAAVASSTFDPRREVVLEGSPASAVGGSRSASPAAITATDPLRVTIDARAEAEGYLVLSDAYYPGWEVYVDGRRSAMLRANYAFRAVQLTPGEHDVEFRYEPRSYQLGLGVSLAAMVAAIAVCLGVCRIPWTRRSKRQW